MKTLLHIPALALLLTLVPTPSFAMMGIEEVSKERAKELGLRVVTGPAGPGVVRVVLDFKKDGIFKSFKRVDLEVHEGGKLLLFASLQEEGTEPGHVVVSFAADRSQLDRIMLRIVTQDSPREMTGYDLRMKDFVDRNKPR